MKRLIAVLSGLLVLPAFAEVAPAYYYEDVMEYADQDYADEMLSNDVDETQNLDYESEMIVAPAPQVASKPSNTRNTTGRAAAGRALSATTNRNTASRTNTATGRTVSARTTAGTSTGRATVSRSSASRVNTTPTNGATVNTNSAARSGAPVAAPNNNTQNVSTRRNATTNANTARASIIQTDTVNKPLYTGRVGVRGTTSVSSRVPTIRMASTSTTDNSTATVSTTDMDELAQITDFCKAQYTQCMDNFCNVLDDNQGRCSCSVNLKNYEKTENALKQATADLQDVAQKIQYIGLSADEVETLFTQTEAELEMQTSNDNSQLKNDLDKIKNMIVEVKSGNASTTSTGMSLDLSGLLDFTIDSTGFDLSSLLNTTSSNASISNQRGETLYKTASARCKASVLNSCAAQGVDTSIITNAYDLEIDKQCIAYERSLTDSNEQMTATVRNAKSVLQKARLLVAQQKNSYDLRGCVNALDSCMQDDFVCGDDYENCLDPTGKYIVNGKIVVGSKPGTSGDINGDLYKTWVYDGKNAWSGTTDGGNLTDYITKTVVSGAAKTSTTDMSKFLQTKIGYHDDSSGKNFGMCMSVLNKCQDITYTGTGQNLKYSETNNVIKEFLQRTLVQIKSAQDSILADYAENCISDVTSCLAQNNYDADKNTGGTLSSQNKLATKACNAIITTCMNVNDITGDAPTASMTAEQWILSIMGD